MLKIKANIRDFGTKMQEIPVCEDTYRHINFNFGIDGENDTISIPTEEEIKATSADTLAFLRADGSRINYSQQKRILWTATGETENIYTVSDFPEVAYYVTDHEKISKKMSPEDSESKDFVKIALRSPHCYIKNRDNVIISHFFDEYSENVETDRHCEGDYVIYNTDFLYRMALSSENKYDFANSELVNYLTEVYYYKNGEKRKMGALTPFKDGADDEFTLYLYGLEGSEDILEEYVENISSYILYGRDERFFIKRDSISDAELKDGTEIMLVVGDMRLEVPISEDFDTSLFQEEAMRQFIEETSEKVINEIVDYEKQQFTPIYNEQEVQKITYKIHLRARKSPEDWVTDDDMGWFDFTASSGDSLYAMGFDEDDAYYRKKKVSESFLRLSFYDSKKRSSQKLLYTAKIYLNSSNIYGEYIEGKNTTDTTYNFSNELGKFLGFPSGAIVEVSDYPLALVETEFTCTNKYDYNNSTEGFYLHLFPSNIKDGDSGIIYMKAELNNAKYGATVPLAFFRDIQHTGYISNGEVDMTALYEDLYIPLTLSFKNRKYTWEMPSVTNGRGIFEEGTLTIHLVEPRINRNM